MWGHFYLSSAIQPTTLSLPTPSIAVEYILSKHASPLHGDEVKMDLMLTDMKNDIYFSDFFHYSSGSVNDVSRGTPWNVHCDSVIEIRMWH